MVTVADFNDSYERVISRDYDAFFKAFYRNFEAGSADVRELFAHGPESRRYEMLESSILMLMDYSTNQTISDELQRLVQYHAKLGVTEKMVDAWLESLMTTLKELDAQFTFDEEVAWRAMLGPGLDYFKSLTRAGA